MYAARSSITVYFFKNFFIHCSPPSVVVAGMYSHATQPWQPMVSRASRRKGKLISPFSSGSCLPGTWLIWICPRQYIKSIMITYIIILSTYSSNISTVGVNTLMIYSPTYCRFFLRNSVRLPSILCAWQVSYRRKRVEMVVRV